MATRYAPVNSDADETPRRYRLSNDRVARPESPLSPTRSNGHDMLDRAMLEFNSSFHQPTTPISAHRRAQNASIAAPTPQRHGSVSSGSVPSRASSSQETSVDELQGGSAQSSHYTPWLRYQQHQEQQATGQTLPQYMNVLPPIPASSPLYQQPNQSYSGFNRPFSSASGPQIVPVQTWNHTREGSVASPPIHTPQNVFGQPHNRLSTDYSAVSQPLVTNSYISGQQQYQRTGSGSRSPSLDSDIEDDDDEEHKTAIDHNGPRHSQYSSGEKPIGDYETKEAIDENEPEPDTLHYGPAPTGRQVRRRRMKKKIALTKGNLVVDTDVPSRLVLPYQNRDEMKSMRYTAVTCDPDEFVKKRFSLRQVEYGRQTELFIVITMYNENEVMFCRTLHGVMKNIAHLTSRKSSKVWGPDSWQKVVVCIVADGRKKVHPRVLDCLTALGVYQAQPMKNMVDGKPVQAHMFEYTCAFGIDADLHFRYPDKGVVPTQIIFLMKEHNQKKLNSHRWFFNAFAPVLQPNICVLLDVGTRPGPNSIYHLWKAFDRNSNVGGACGEIAAYKGPWWSYLLNPLIAAQNYEYKMSNILDKPNESMFGYISVLPGAFSAYRYIALQNDKNTGVGPLASYFKGEVLQGRGADIFTSNMYLAEDRILSFELVAKRNSDWILKYVRGAVGETDVPYSLDELIVQRRRWLNGSFFAAVYALAHNGQIFTSGHSFARKFWLAIESLYNAINLVFSWFAIGNFCIFFVILTSSIENPVFKLPPKTIHFVNLATHYLLATIIMACFLFSMGNRPKASPWKYNTATTILSLLTGYMVACAVMCAIHVIKQVHHTAVYRNMVFSILVTYGAWLISSILALDPWHLILCLGQYTLLSPLYIIVLNIYAFANLDDITWGTKGSDVVQASDLGNVVQDSQHLVEVEYTREESDEQYTEALENLKTRKPLPRRGLLESEKDLIHRDYYANLRTNLLLAWALSNALLVVFILNGVSPRDTFSNTAAGARSRAYMTFVLAFVAITSIIRFIGSTLFMIMVAITG
ncbi:hypothetical protein FS842_002000 [Serendipita sp. 407]|nr:hypothetical protein FS842_002000 [Serendipita sp. 407]